VVLLIYIFIRERHHTPDPSFPAADQAPVLHPLLPAQQIKRDTQLVDQVLVPIIYSLAPVPLGNAPRLVPSLKVRVEAVPPLDGE
jgi:hypothetical protein